MFSFKSCFSDFCIQSSSKSLELAVVVVTIDSETQFLPSLPTCVSWQPGCEHSLAVATETGHLLLQDCRVGVGTPDVQCVHTRHVNRLAFAPHQ